MNASTNIAELAAIELNENNESLTWEDRRQLTADCNVTLSVLPFDLYSFMELDVVHHNENGESAILWTRDMGLHPRITGSYRASSLFIRNASGEEFPIFNICK